MAETEAVEETTEESGPRSQMWKHEAMVTWLESENDVDLSEASAAEVIALAFAQRVPWRKSDTYRNLVESHAAEADAAREAKAAEREAAKVAREEEKAAKAAAKAEADAAKAAAKESGEAEKPAPKKRASRSRAKATKADDGDSVFD